MVQNTIIFILGLTILITAMVIIIVMFLGVLRVALMTVFEWDYVVAYKNWKNKPKTLYADNAPIKPTKAKMPKVKEPKQDIQLGYYIKKEEDNENL